MNLPAIEVAFCDFCGITTMQNAIGSVDGVYYRCQNCGTLRIYLSADRFSESDVNVILENAYNMGDARWE